MLPKTLSSGAKTTKTTMGILTSIAMTRKACFEKPEKVV
jgi:hypothetical protein